MGRGVRGEEALVKGPLGWGGRAGVRARTSICHYSAPGLLISRREAEGTLPPQTHIRLAWGLLGFSSGSCFLLCFQFCTENICLFSDDAITHTWSTGASVVFEHSCCSLRPGFQAQH